MFLTCKRNPRGPSSRKEHHSRLTIPFDSTKGVVGSDPGIAPLEDEKTTRRRGNADVLRSFGVVGLNVDENR